MQTVTTKSSYYKKVSPNFRFFCMQIPSYKDMQPLKYFSIRFLKLFKCNVVSLLCLRFWKKIFFSFKAITNLQLHARNVWWYLFSVCLLIKKMSQAWTAKWVRCHFILPILPPYKFLGLQTTLYWQGKGKHRITHLNTLFTGRESLTSWKYWKIRFKRCYTQLTPGKWEFTTKNCLLSHLLISQNLLPLCIVW